MAQRIAGQRAEINLVVLGSRQDDAQPEEPRPVDRDLHDVESVAVLKLDHLAGIGVSDPDDAKQERLVGQVEPGVVERREDAVERPRTLRGGGLASVIER